MLVGKEAYIWKWHCQTAKHVAAKLIRRSVVWVVQEGQAYADEYELFFMETSAKTSYNVNELFYEIGKNLCQ